MNMLTVTAYNVGFGDALLVEFPDRHEGRTTMRRILIDMGNVLAGQGGPDRVFRAVAKDVRARLGGGAIDLFVMSHEHLDHVRGLPYLASVGLEIPVDYAWLTASANPRYGQRYPKAQAQRLALAAQVTHLGVAARALAIDGRPVRAFLENNNPFDTRACVDFLSGIARIRRCYVHSRFTVVPGKHHPFHEARLSIWAPEPNTLTYYGRFLPRIPQSLRRQKYPATPPGVDTKAFRALIRSMQSGLGENMLAIDRAANNTSIVLCLEWRGWRLLFTGDAERRSWLEMAKRRLLRPVHFLKVSHHGSHNGTPDDEILDAVFPEPRPDDRSRSVLLSTCPDTYNGVPDDTTIARITARVDVVRSTRSVPLGDSVKLEFPDRA